MVLKHCLPCSGDPFRDPPRIDSDATELIIIHTAGYNIYKETMLDLNPFFELWLEDFLLYRSEFRPNSSRPEWRPIILNTEVLENVRSLQLKVLDRNTVLGNTPIGESTIKLPLDVNHIYKLKDKAGRERGRFTITEVTGINLEPYRDNVTVRKGPRPTSVSDSGRSSLSESTKERRHVKISVPSLFDHKPVEATVEHAIPKPVVETRHAPAKKEPSERDVSSDDLQVPVIPKVDSLVKKDPELSVTSIKSKQSLKDRLQAADKEVQALVAAIDTTAHEMAKPAIKIYNEESVSSVKEKHERKHAEPVKHVEPVPVKVEVKVTAEPLENASPFDPPPLQKAFIQEFIADELPKMVKDTCTVVQDALGEFYVTTVEELTKGRKCTDKQLTCAGVKAMETMQGSVALMRQFGDTLKDVGDKSIKVLAKEFDCSLKNLTVVGVQTVNMIMAGATEAKWEIERMADDVPSKTMKMLTKINEHIRMDKISAAIDKAVKDIQEKMLYMCKRMEDILPKKSFAMGEYIEEVGDKLDEFDTRFEQLAIERVSKMFKGIAYLFMD